MRLKSWLLVLTAWPSIALAHPESQTGAPLARPVLAPSPDWVAPATMPKAPSDSEGAATIDLLGDIQVRFGNAGDTTHYAQLWKIGTAQGLDDGAMQVDWDPALETLTLHRYRVLRDGKPIDLLGDGSKISVVQRETRMESAMLDGRLTASIQPEDLRVGDVIDLAYSVTRHDPAMQGKSEFVAGPRDGSAFGRYRVRMLWDKDKPMRWRVLPGVLVPKVKEGPSGKELVADLTDMAAPLPPEGAPSRFQLVNAIEVTEFADWQGVSRTFAPLYAEAEKLAENSPLKAEIARIAAASPDPRRRTELALQLVQEQIRYLFLGMNDGGFVPASADQTWARRFGDCKAKTVLLTTLLTALGIDARPVLVHTENGDYVADRLPSMESFDHAIVEARIDGKSYWLDGTRLGDLRLDRVATPNYKVGLPLTLAGEGLAPIVPPPLDAPGETITLNLDASKGLDVPAKAEGEMRFHGPGASDMRLKYAAFSQADRNRELRKLWRDTYDFISPGKVATREDPATGDFVVTMQGSAAMEWSADLGTRWYEMDRARLGWRFDIAREGELNRDAPFAFDYPDWWASKEVIKLPGGGKGFRMQGGSVDKVVGNLYHFKRKVDLVDGVATMEAETRALAGELPAAKAAQTRAQMIELAGVGVFIRAPEDYEPTAGDRGVAKAAANAAQRDAGGGEKSPD